MPCTNVGMMHHCRRRVPQGQLDPVRLSMEAKAEAVWFVLNSRRAFTILDTAKLE